MSRDHVGQPVGSGAGAALAVMIRSLCILAPIIAACSNVSPLPSVEGVPTVTEEKKVQPGDGRAVRSSEVSKEIHGDDVDQDDGREDQSAGQVSEGIDGCRVRGEDERGARSAQRVSRVIDGDTVQLEDGRRLRYAGINAPEEGEPYYRESTQANNLLVGNKEVDLEFGRSKTDKHRRLLAYVCVGRTLIQGELVRQGWALVMRTQPLHRYRELLLKSQEEAKDNGRGIWTKGQHRGQLTIVGVHPRESKKKSANDEFVVFKNTGGSSLDLTGWSISDEANRSYLVPRFTLGPGDSFTLFTGPGKNSDQALYWGRRGTVWNKGGDTVIVKDATGHYVASHIYGPKGR